uniref:Uncharacterized protein n=1 Tax=Tetranychus urticae TaxID=32264 RepID=T1JPP9_TETUR
MIASSIDVKLMVKEVSRRGKLDLKQTFTQHLHKEWGRCLYCFAFRYPVQLFLFLYFVPYLQRLLSVQSRGSRDFLVKHIDKSKVLHTRINPDGNFAATINTFPTELFDGYRECQHVASSLDETMDANKVGVKTAAETKVYVSLGEKMDYTVY